MDNKTNVRVEKTRSIVIVKTKFGETISAIGTHQIKFNTPFITHSGDLLNQIRRDQGIRSKR